MQISFLVSSKFLKPTYNYFENAKNAFLNRVWQLGFRNNKNLMTLVQTFKMLVNIVPKAFNPG